eukprot:251073_1
MSQLKPENKRCDVLQTIGLVSLQQPNNSSQDNTWRAGSGNEPSHKSAIKVIHQDNNQDLFSDQSILKYLAQHSDSPNTIIKLHHVFQQNQDYYVVMEEAGIPLFDFVIRAHSLIRAKKLTITHWQQVTKAIFKQMIEAIEYMHSKNVCHFDISLQSFFINDVTVDVYPNTITFCIDSIQIKLCAFELSELFNGSDCLSSKFCGKQGYQSPEIVNQKTGFDAKMNDIWCLGVCFFTMVTGLSPWQTASALDNAFVYIVKYRKMVDLLGFWKVKHYVNKDVIDVIQSIFDYEERRPTLNEIKQHPFLK